MISALAYGWKGGGAGEGDGGVGTSSTLEALEDARIKEQTPQNFTAEPNIWYPAAKSRPFENRTAPRKLQHGGKAAPQLAFAGTTLSAFCPLVGNLPVQQVERTVLGKPREEKEDFQQGRLLCCG